ncbi:MAG TPA: EAL domain-containing protein [Longimicrobium sp.]
MTSLSWVISATQASQSVGALLLAGLLWTFHGHYRRAYLRSWAVSWLFFAARMSTGAAGMMLADTRGPGTATQIVLVAAGSLAAYLHAVFLLAGAWELKRGDAVAWRRVLWVVPPAAILAVATSFTYLADPAAVAERYLARGGVRMLLAGLAFGVAAVSVWRIRNHEVRIGRWLLGTGFALFGAQQFHYLTLAVFALGSGDAMERHPYMGMADALLQWMIGLGMVVCLLEEERGRAVRSAERAEHLAYHDALTGLPNRRLLLDRLGVMLARAGRDGEYVGVLFLDLDRFKVINDSLGHSAGDRLLQEAGARIRAAVREGDTVARIGGDEFVLLLPGLSAPADVQRVASKVTDAVRAPFVLDGDELFVTTSTGAAVAPNDGGDAETLLKHADIAMYRAKDAGGDGFHFFTQAMNERARERLELETALRRALAAGQLVVHYQPVWDVEEGRVTAAEALVRWNHPQRGLIQPAAFLEVAEAVGLIAAIDVWVLRTACAELRRWHDAGHTHLSVFVNLSARQFGRPDLLDEVRSALADAGVSPRRLELEITEGVAMRDAVVTEAVLRELKELGVRISIDDFGTGYSSFGYLRRFPLDTLKVDRTFVTDVDTDEGNAAIASAIIAMAHRLGLRAVAEGVERPGQMEFLREQGCDAVQGFLLSHPLPADEMDAFLATPSPLGAGV